jgi:putative transposase
LTYRGINALAESFNGLYKTELIHRKGPWRNVEHVEWETLKYVDWFNNRRIHSALSDLSPAEFEAKFYAETEAVISAASETIGSLRNPV